MTKPLTVLDYSRRIERVIAHIGEHLHDSLDLDRLAAVACFSPFHFHRIYRAMTGETAADTLRRLRLHHAAGELVQGQAPIAALARQAGYRSIAAFTRAFGASYGISPSAYRRAGRLVPPSPAATETETAMYDVSVRELQPARLAALRHAGSYLEIGPTFERLFAWAIGRGLMGPQPGRSESTTTIPTAWPPGICAPMPAWSSAPRSPSMATSASSRFPAAAMRCCTTAAPMPS